MYSLGFWNVGGLNNPAKQRHIKWFMFMHKVGLFGLLETKVKSLSLNSVKGILMDGWSLTTNNSMHKEGRVWVLWDPTIFTVDLCDYFAQCINMRVNENSTKIVFKLSMVYAYNDINGRHELWNQLDNFANNGVEPWLVCGDFNCVLAHSERLGGSSSDAEIAEFQQCLTKCELVDSPAMGSLFTWNNKQEPATRVYSRLDRVLINGKWSTRMTDMYAHFLPEGAFDHTSCVIKCRRQLATHNKPFKYYNMWGKAANFINALSNWWDVQQQGTKMFCLVKKLKHLKLHLRNFNKEFFCDIENTSAMALKNLEYIQAQIVRNHGNADWIAKEIEAQQEYKELQAACTQFLSHKAKAAWIKDGDSNSKYFHGVIKSKFLRN
ncbi:uncharacterized protein LOC141601629 [Silene latifolia]|uniref:uncharacterized protein LOC141601629 n=1 Tax=Silene latifolia TaxID=37657 RepID=UPI003D784850